MTAALERGEWSAARPGPTLTPGKTRYQLYRRLDGPEGWSGRAEILVPTEIRFQTVQPVVSCKEPDVYEFIEPVLKFWNCWDQDDNDDVCMYWYCDIFRYDTLIW